MMNAAIYARTACTASDIDSQINICRRIAERHGYTVAQTYCDRGSSGSSIRDRDGLAALLRSGDEKRIDAVIVESLDRLSRDTADLAMIVKGFANIKIVTAQGPMS